MNDCELVYRYMECEKQIEGMGGVVRAYSDGFLIVDPDGVGQQVNIGTSLEALEALVEKWKSR